MSKRFVRHGSLHGESSTSRYVAKRQFLLATEIFQESSTTNSGRQPETIGLMSKVVYSRMRARMPARIPQISLACRLKFF
eukprot:6200718-Pleurochrysis_carterae.AAC.2